MYKLQLPDYQLNDFFDEILKGRQGAASKFLFGRLKSIKPFLINKEEEYRSLMFSKGGNKLFTIAENKLIEIPKNLKLGQFLNFSNSITKNDLIEKLREYGLEPLFENITTMELSQIRHCLNRFNLEEALSVIDAENELYKVMSYIDSTAMKNAYENYIVESEDSGKKGRDIYEHILLLADDGICPYCMYGDVSTVDHYLPKAYFIEYAITPLNLLPSCYECNTKKKDLRKLEENKMFINPYCDDLTKIRWLECNLVDNMWPITFKFNVAEDIESVIIKEKLNEQFKTLSLGKLYATKAGRYFRIRAKKIVENYESGGSESIIEALKDDKISAEEYNLNALEAKVYEALLNSKWFLEEGIKNVKSFYLEK
ncbi:HNH endonuclease [Priestia megaterium]|uniref:HNH endonuclease n=1 Tax=Priestia megaterium TaxID=1404 RepID=UPI001C230AA2|nr:HNH endonuclease signature motif containing protein [Priestia megaterium]MBU8689493.1 HNH endonuclease [Priestia megaterium]